MRDVMITQTEGRSSQYLEFYHPDGIREIRMRLANFARMVIDLRDLRFVLFVQFVFSKIKRQILPDSNNTKYISKQSQNILGQ